MRLVKRSPWLNCLGVLLAGMMVVGAARAEVTIDSAGSLIIYPKVVSDGSRDTLIQLSNTSNSSAFVHCFYINTLGQCSTSDQSCRLDSDCPDTELCVRTCEANNFDVILTAQQPMQWRASTGRLASLTPPPCRVGQPCQCTPGVGGQICPGLEVGANNQPFAPGVGTAFEGELKCYQTDQTQTFPIAGNALKGTATLETLASGQISEYNALAIAANADLVNGVNNNQDLRLNFSGAGAGEYNYCPRNLVFTHHGEGAVDPVTNATISTEITLVPCTELIEEAESVPVIVSFVGFNEFEQRLSADGVRFDCFFSRRLSDIPTDGQGIFVASAGNLWKMRVTPSSSDICLTGTNRGLTCVSDTDPVNGCPGHLVSPGGVSLGCQPAPGVLGVIEEFDSITGLADGTAAVNVHVEGQRTGFGDIITTPQLQ